MDEKGVSKESPLKPTTDFKFRREKRDNVGSDERHEHAPKCVKMRDLHSVFASDAEASARNLKSIRNDELGAKLKLSSEEMSQVTEVPAAPNAEALELGGNEKSNFHMDADICIAKESASSDSSCYNEECQEPPILVKHIGDQDTDLVKQRQIGLDLKVEDVPSLDKHDLSCSSKNQSHLRLGDVSESGSSIGPLEKVDPMKVWLEMKRNGFLSCPLGAVATASSEPKQQEKQAKRKRKSDPLKKKMELAKREEVDRFSKIAAPSGLLNGLNPGIINHVRNKKQVHSIIEALVRYGSEGAGPRKNEADISDLDVDHHGFSSEDVSISDRKRIRKYTMSMDRHLSTISEDKSGDGGSSVVGSLSKDDIAALKLSTNVSENASSLCYEGSANCPRANSLTVKAARVASQWLELLSEDIKGRLSALLHCRKRVRDVLTTELPFLILKEFPSNQEINWHAMNNSADASDHAGLDIHHERWTMLFDQIDKDLSEEEKELGTWLNQVTQMQLHCHLGLQHFNQNSVYHRLQLGISETESRSGKAARLEMNSVLQAAAAARLEMNSVLQAAAASVYSTCNFASLKENR